MNIFLLVVVIVMVFMILLGSVYVLVYFQAEEDRNTAYAPKVAVVFGLMLACLMVLMLPLDVANRSMNAGLDMELLWYIMYTTITVMLVGVCPFLIFYYEAEDPESREYQFWTAVKYEGVTVVVLGIVLVILWATGMGYAHIPITSYVFNATEGLLDLDMSNPVLVGNGYFDTLEQFGGEGVWITLTVSVTPVVFTTSLISFIGWWFFVLFAGVGFAALPMDLLVEYAQRPQRIDVQEYAKQKMMLNDRANKLVEIGKKLGNDAHRARDRKTRNTFNKFKQAVYFLEKDWEKVKVAYKEHGGNPLFHVIKCGCGILSVILSVTWYLHIILYVFVTPPADLFLNNYFTMLDNAFGLFGVCTYGIYAFYLLVCVIKGNMKLGVRFFCIQIHPMKIGATMMNSLLFNTELLLLCCLSAVQFCYIAFQTYARLTAIDMLFGVQVRNMAYLSWFFRAKFFLIALTAVSCCTIVYLSIYPNDKRALEDEDEL